MTRANRLRSWRELGFRDRTFRILCGAGAALFGLGWLIKVWMMAVAVRQPGFPVGMYQNAWPFKGRIAYLTDGQFAWAQYADILMYGWFLAAVAGCWTAIVEKKAERRRVEAMLRDYQPSRGD